MSPDEVNNPRPVAMDSYVTFGLVTRVPLHVANEILELLKRHGEPTVRFSYHRISNNKLRLEEGGPEKP